MLMLIKMLQTTNFKGSKSGENNDVCTDLQHYILRETHFFLTVLFELALTDIWRPFPMQLGRQLSSHSSITEHKNKRSTEIKICQSR